MRKRRLHNGCFELEVVLDGFNNCLILVLLFRVVLWLQSSPSGLSNSQAFTCLDIYTKTKMQSWMEPSHSLSFTPLKTKSLLGRLSSSFPEPFVGERQPGLQLRAARGVRKNGPFMCHCNKFILYMNASSNLKGTLGLNDPVHKYLQYWTKDSKDPRSRVTLFHLLSFQSGYTFGLSKFDSCWLKPLSNFSAFRSDGAGATDFEDGRSLMRMFRNIFHIFLGGNICLEVLLVC